MTPYYSEDGIIIYNADCRDILPHLEPVDLVLTDPPYGHNNNNDDTLLLRKWNCNLSW
jgi:DNA modification methylase